MYKPVKDYVFVEVEKDTEDVISVGGKEMFFDTAFSPKEHARIYGKAVAVPTKLSSSHVIEFEDKGVPIHNRNPQDRIDHLLSIGYPVSRGDYGPYWYEAEHTYLNAIHMEVEVGDRVYYHFNSLREDNNLSTDKKKVYKVHYEQIICVVREGKIIPIGNHVLVQPVMETEDDITTKTGLFKKSEVEAKYLEGYVRYIGKPLKGYKELGVEPGDRILYKPESDWTNKIEGKEYFVMKQKDLILKFDK